MVTWTSNTYSPLLSTDTEHSRLSLTLIPMMSPFIRNVWSGNVSLRTWNKEKKNSLLRQNWLTSHTWRPIPNSNSYAIASKRPTNYLSAILLLSWVCDAEKSSILRCDSVIGWVVPNTANNHNAFILKVNSPRRTMGCDTTSLHRKYIITLQRITGFIYWLLEHGDEGITILQNVGNYTSNNTTLNARRLDPSGPDTSVLWGRTGLMFSQDMHINNHVIKIYLLESQVIVHDVKPGSLIFRIHWVQDGNCRYFFIFAPCLFYL
jgi:hypothetical protein